MIKLSLPSEITCLTAKFIHWESLPLFPSLTRRSQTPSFFAHALILCPAIHVHKAPAAPRILGSWYTLVQMEGDIRFVYNCCLSLATANAIDGRLLPRQAVMDWRRCKSWTSARFKLLTGWLETAGAVLGHISHGLILSERHWCSQTQNQNCTGRP